MRVHRIEFSFLACSYILEPTTTAGTRTYVVASVYERLTRACCLIEPEVFQVVADVCFLLTSGEGTTACFSATGQQQECVCSYVGTVGLLYLTALLPCLCVGV
ncbi:hypothetical protein R3P38DRAFT_95063 [Favolaschia claudopus]|uniref:Uncharacterized protein n=1 Tax=Favolaschia claudopus TaxID=2862362 RepID=A0AAW0D473_9AGAR